MSLFFSRGFSRSFSQNLPKSSRSAILALGFRRVVLVLAGVGLLTLSAKVQVPFYPVPMTLQTMALMVIGCFFARSLAWTSVLSYVLLGALGLPIFAKGGGMPYLLGPTGGYLLGFLPAMWLFAKVRDSAMRSLMILFAGIGVIYACGVLWLGSVIGWDKPLLALGLFPFLLGDVAKVCVVWGMLWVERGRVGGLTRKW